MPENRRTNAGHNRFVGIRTTGDQMQFVEWNGKEPPTELEKQEIRSSLLQTRRLPGHGTGGVVQPRSNFFENVGKNLHSLEDPDDQKYAGQVVDAALNDPYADHPVKKRTSVHSGQGTDGLTAQHKTGNKYNVGAFFQRDEEDKPVKTHRLRIDQDNNVGIDTGRADSEATFVWNTSSGLPGHHGFDHSDENVVNDQHYIELSEEYQNGQASKSGGSVLAKSFDAIRKGIISRVTARQNEQKRESINWHDRESLIVNPQALQVISEKTRENVSQVKDRLKKEVAAEKQKKQLADGYDRLGHYGDNKKAILGDDRAIKAIEDFTGESARSVKSRLVRESQKQEDPYAFLSGMDGTD